MCKSICLNSYFQKDIYTRDGLTARYKDCRNIKKKKHFYDNREKEIRRRIQFRPENLEEGCILFER